MTGWRVEILGNGRAYLVTPGGIRAAQMTVARCRGIAAALNTAQGRQAFEQARVEEGR